LEWHAQTWVPLEKELEEIGFRWKALVDEIPPNLAKEGDLLRIKDAVELVPDIFHAQMGRIKLTQLEETLNELADRLTLYASNGSGPRVIEALLQAIAARDAASYAETFKRLVDLCGRRSTLSRRQELLKRLAEADLTFVGERDIFLFILDVFRQIVIQVGKVGVVIDLTRSPAQKGSMFVEAARAGEIERGAYVLKADRHRLGH